MRVNLDTEAYEDPRFARLGLALGAPQEFAHDVGLSRMTRVWAYCTKRGAHCLEDWEVVGFIGRQDAMTLLVDARLAAPDPGGGYYIAGTRGRIEWYSTAIANGRRGGRPRNQPVVSSSDPDPNHLDNHPVTHPGNHPGNHPQEKEKEDLGSSPDLVLVATSRARSVGPTQAQRTEWATAVYRAYPRKEGKAGGLKRLAAQLASPEVAASALRAAENYASHCLAEGRELAFVKHFSTWVSEWRDWVKPEATPAIPARASPLRVVTGGIDTSGLPDLSGYED